MRRFAVLVSVLASAICLPVAPAVAQSPSPSPLAASVVPQLGFDDVVVYARSDREGAPVSLYAVGADGTPQLLSPAPINCCATASHDGTLVAFEAPSADGMHAETGLVRTDGSGLQILDSSDGGNLSPGLFLPDGRLVAVTWKEDEPGRTSLLIMDPTAADPISTATRIDGLFDTPLSASPDSTRMLLALGPDAATPGQLLVITTDGSSQKPLGSQAVDVSDDPFWGPAAEFSRDGSQITFSTGPGGQRTSYVANADGSNVNSIGSSLTAAHWSPAQDFLAVDRQLSTGNGIVIVQPDGTEIATLVSEGAFAPIWSPDGTRLVIQQGLRIDNLSVVDLAGQAQQITNDPGVYAWVSWGRLPSPLQPTPSSETTPPMASPTTEAAATAP